MNNKNNLTKIFNFLVEIKHYLFRHHLKYSFSQEGEDLLLERIFYNHKKGFYVDVGAHHPFRFSNTMLFYKKGWEGINIDASPGSMKRFNMFRPRDLNLELPISNDSKVSTYYRFNDSALNTFSKILAEERIIAGASRLIETIKIKTFRLSDIFHSHLTNNPTIDFMSIDVEGHEYEVVSSNNWSLYRPKVVLVEILYKTLENLMEDRTVRFLNQCGYLFFAKTVGTCFFITKDFFHDRFGKNIIACQ